MIEDSPNIQMPERSRLFSLPMSGHCGATQESILSYAQRICAEHRVPVRRMFIDFILPESGLCSLLHSTGSAKILDPKNLLGLNSCSENSAAFVEGLQRLTGRRGLERGTFLAWQRLFAKGIGTAKSRRWCAHCLAEQQDQEYVAFSLLWTPKDVRACPIHKAVLLERCVRCDRAQPIIGDGPTRGHCEYCRSHLGDAAHCETSPVPSARDLFYAEAVAEIVSMGGGPKDLITAARYREQLGKIAREHCGGSLYRLAKELQIGRNSLEREGGTTMASFLEVTYRLEVKPLALLMGTGALSPQHAVRALGCQPRRGLSAGEREALRHSAPAVVHDALQNARSVIPIADLARRLRVSANALTANCPELVNLVREHNARARPHAQKELRSRLEAAARQAMRDLIAQGGIATARAVNDALVDAGVHWSRTEARAAANEELARLRRDTA